MKYHHLTFACFGRNRDLLEKAFKEQEPSNAFSQNWSADRLQCVVKAPDVKCVGPGVLAVYDDAPVKLVTSKYWLGSVGKGA